MAKRSTKRKPATTAPAVPLDPNMLRRVVVEGVHPEVDGGRFPIKRVAGEDVTVSADVHADGHDVIAAALLHRRAGGAWAEVPMAHASNDRWTATFTVEEIGEYEYTIEAWVDRFETWRHELSKKFGAGQDVSSELLEGAELIRTAERLRPERGAKPPSESERGWGPASAEKRLRPERGAKPPSESERGWGPASAEKSGPIAQPNPYADVSAAASEIADASLPAGTRVARALSEPLRAAMGRLPDRERATRYDRVLRVLVEPVRARYGAWYEMFPRSAGTDPSRSATFDEAAARLPYVASMGFDVLYLPPIHPIGRSFRKGPNNTLQAGPGDPGSPWAIGSEEGGHDAVEPGLGTIEDFDRFVETARRHGLDIALDLAYQASPDHPYVKAHPEWFRRRPDGTIKYAENPPKKYQDIYPINFESEDWQALWTELKRIIEFWIEHGVRIFRVDNPHTKPYAFWAWALADVRRTYPDAIFLSEAFTRPKVMRYLAKCGFSQSYTYFTWRNTKEELVEYFTELTRTDVREYMRANLFANTPDILHEYLQHGGRPAFEVRLILAATLGANYGIYSGFELAENAPVRPGSEEYLDSEKYQIRPRNFDQPHTLAELIRRVNQIRDDHGALQRDRGLRFHQTDNPHLICYSKRTVDGSDLLLMVVNLDPLQMQHGFVRLPLADWGVGPDTTIEVQDLLWNERYYWRGEWNYVRLDPEARAGHILHVRLGSLPPQNDEPLPLR